MNTTNCFDMPLFKGRTSGLPFVKGSETSIIAAGRVKGNTVNHDRCAIVYALYNYGGLTDPEISRLTGIEPNSERPRRISMTEKTPGDGGQIRKRMKDGKCVKRDGKFTVWELVG